MALVQGTNCPLEIEFDRDLTDMPALIISAWSPDETLVKRWDKTDVTIEENVVLCPLTEQESQAFPLARLTIEAKGLDEYGATVFWSAMRVQVVKRRDKVISLVDDESE